MARYAYFFGGQVWLIKSPDTGGTFNPQSMADTVLQCSTKHGILIDHACDGLIVFDFKKYRPLASEEAQQDIERRSGSVSNMDFQASSSFILRRTEIMNAHSICLKAAIRERQKFGIPATWVSPHGVVHMSDANDSLQSVSFKSQWDSYQYSARYGSQYGASLPPQFDPRVGLRSLVVVEESLRDAVDRLESCVEKVNDGALKLCSLINLAVNSLEDHDYPRCLVTCWVVIEAFLNKKWQDYLRQCTSRDVSGGRTFINKDRFKKLTSNDYTASIITENLSLVGKLSFEEYSLVEEVRRTRNKWMHELADVPIDKASIALRAAAELFKSEFSVELPSGTSLRL